MYFLIFPESLLGLVNDRDSVPTMTPAGLATGHR